MNLHLAPRSSIARTGSGLVFGLRTDFPGASIFQADHDGCIDRSAFLANGSTLAGDNGLTLGLRITSVHAIDARGDFPTQEEREEDMRLAEASRADMWLVEQFEADQAANDFANDL